MKRAGSMQGVLETQPSVSKNWGCMFYRLVGKNYFSRIILKVLRLSTVAINFWIFKYIFSLISGKSLNRNYVCMKEIRALYYIPVDLAHEDVDEFDGKGFQQVEIVVCCVGDINYKHNVRSENCFCDLQDARIEVMYLRHLIFLFFFFLFSVVCVFWNEEIHKILISNKTKPDVPLLQILPGVLP